MGGDWSAYERACYEKYCQDFRHSTPWWPVPNETVSIRRNPEVDGRAFTYLHITTEGPVEADRLPAPSRCERIGWPRLLIDEFGKIYPAASSARVCWWMNSRTGRRGLEVNYLIALADFSYVVVLASRASYAMLITAYPVEHENRRNKLRREFDEYWRKGGGRPA